MDHSIIRLSKLNAAQRRLRTAITLFFSDGDPVSIHTLAFAAYEVFHYVSHHREPNRRDLLFDSDMIKEEFRRDWNQLLRKEANFCKHGNRDPDCVIDFTPAFSELFIVFAILGRQICGEEQSEEETLFLWWSQINRTDQLTDEGRRFLADRIPVNLLNKIRGLFKPEFRKQFLEARLARKRPVPIVT